MLIMIIGFNHKCGKNLWKLYDDDDKNDDDDDWLCGKYLWKIQETPGIGATLDHFSSHKNGDDDDYNDCDNSCNSDKI